MRKANLFIVGAPKCGTTTLYEALQCHPNIYMSISKEPEFFSTDLAGSRSVESLESYEKLFCDAMPHHKILGEASIGYLCSKKAASKIFEYNPDAKIIIMLRNPVDMIYSLYKNMRHELIEDKKTFEEALAAESERESKLPQGIFDFHQYRKFGRYAAQVERFLKLFGQNQVHIIIFDDFVRNTEKAYSEVLAFLGLNYHSAKLNNRNPSMEFRSEYLQKFLLFSPTWVRRCAHLIFTPDISRKIFHSLFHLNSKRTKNKMLAATRVALMKEFSDEINELSEVIGRDLFSWKNNVSVPPK